MLSCPAMSDADAASLLVNHIWEVRYALKARHGPPPPPGLGLPPWRDGDADLLWDDLDDLTVRVSGIAERHGLDSTILHTLTRTRHPMYLDAAEDFAMRVLSVAEQGEPNPRASHRQPTASELAVLQVLQEDGFIGVESLAHLTSKQRPTGAYLAKRAVGRSADGQFKTVLSHMVDLGWIGNGQHERAGPGYFLKPLGQSVFRSSQRSGPSPD
ncbi:MAG: hypothetical protein IT349_21220 [Candidatus Eisenbacteria bacterium]|nr:hypothetical protein [Candidatus Eisenbacteria bacterium]